MSFVIQNSLSVAANTVSANVIAGEVNEFLEGPSQIDLFLAGSAAGLNVTFQVGNEVFIQDQALGAQNRFPLIPDDFYGRGFGGAGERLFVQFRNTTGGALTAFYRLEIKQVA